MNYRLNAFGFMALEWLAGQSPKNVSGNYGFMDMIAALRWVNRNIEAFGGDKNQVSGIKTFLQLYNGLLCIWTYGPDIIKLFHASLN